MKEDVVIPEFLNKVTPRVGPANAVGFLRDAQLCVFRVLFKELGVKQSHIDELIEAQLTKTAQDVLNIPVPSPFPRIN